MELETVSRRLLSMSTRILRSSDNLTLPENRCSETFKEVLLSRKAALSNPGSSGQWMAIDEPLLSSGTLTKRHNNRLPHRHQ
eukprot:scaffold212336_cov17-Prasinocladus_malaysianus.AAC.1